MRYLLGRADIVAPNLLCLNLSCPNVVRFLLLRFIVIFESARRLKDLGNNTGSGIFFELSGEYECGRRVGLSTSLVTKLRARIRRDDDCYRTSVSRPEIASLYYPKLWLYHRRPVPVPSPLVMVVMASYRAQECFYSTYRRSSGKCLPADQLGRANV